jgi:hypothetical protein
MPSISHGKKKNLLKSFNMMRSNVEIIYLNDVFVDEKKHGVEAASGVARVQVARERHEGQR